MPNSNLNTSIPLFSILCNNTPLLIRGMTLSHTKPIATDVIAYLNSVSDDSYTLERVGYTDKPRNPTTSKTSKHPSIHKSELERLGISISNVFATDMPDDSMNMSKGDSIYIDTARKTIKDGNIYAIELDGMFYCKRLFKTANGIDIKSDAEGYPDRQLDVKDIVERGFKVMGWVFKWSHLELWETRMLLPPEQMEVSA